MNNSEKQQKLEEAAKVESEMLISSKFFKIRREILHFPDHPPHEWMVIDHPGAVAMIPVADDGDLILIRQWRRPIEKIIYEIPAGCIDPGESLETCAQRELQEEVNYKAQSLIPLGAVYPAPGYSNEKLHFFIAKGLEESSLDGDIHEAIDVEKLSLERCLQLVDSGNIDDAKTITAILRYDRWLKTHA